MASFSSGTGNHIRPTFPLRRVYNINDIYYYPNLNIFSDASTRNTGASIAAAYGVAAVTQDNVIETSMKIHSNTSSNAEELRGVKTAIAMGLRYRHLFPRINIFSDSLYSINSVRDYPSYWVFDEVNHVYYGRSRGEPVKNMDIIAEALYLLEELRKTNEVNIYYIKGHVPTDSNNMKTFNSLMMASSTFIRENFNVDGTSVSVRGKVDINMVRYLCGYNNLVDMLSRGLLYRSNIFENTYRDAATFELDHPVYFN